MEYDILHFICPACDNKWIGKFIDSPKDVGTLIIGSWKCSICHSYGEIEGYIAVREKSIEYKKAIKNG